MANKLVRSLPDGWTITVVDQDDRHVYQPGLLLLPFGQYAERDLIRPRGQQLDPDIRYVVSPIERVDPEAKTATLGDGQVLSWDLLLIASGCGIRPELTPGLTGKHWKQSIFDFYTLEGSVALASALERFEGGRLVVNPVDMPIKCPVAPLEFVLLADAFFTERGIRDKVELVYVTSLDGAFTKPKASAALGGLLAARNIEVVTEFTLEKVDEDHKALVGYDGREVPFDLLVTVPLHGGAAFVSASGLGDDLGFVPTHRHTLQSLAHPDIFVIGDATDLPTSKAGAVAHFEGEVVEENLLRHLAGEPLVEGFDGHANCFIETGFGKAMLIDFNYETEPLPGRFPLPGIGPFTLLEESAVNHWGKLAFKWMYWDLLVAGKELPMENRMSPLGKWS